MAMSETEYKTGDRVKVIHNIMLRDEKHVGKIGTIVHKISSSNVEDSAIYSVKFQNGDIATNLYDEEIERSGPRNIKWL